MALNVCEDCSTLFSVGAAGCPHCGSDRHHEQGAETAAFDVRQAKKAELIKEAERRDLDVTQSMTVKELRKLLS